MKTANYKVAAHDWMRGELVLNHLIAVYNGKILQDFSGSLSPRECKGQEG